MVGRAGQRAGHCEVRCGAAIGDVVKEAVSRREEKTELQLSPKRSKGALGAAEATNFAVESQLRTMRLGLLARYPSEKVSGDNRLVAWMVRHCGWLLTRFQMKATGRAAYCSRMGREYRREIVEFAEQVLFHISESSGPGGHCRKAHAALGPRRLGREDQRQRRAHAADAVWVEACNKNQETARDVKVEHSVSADGLGAALEPHGNGGRKGDGSRHREGQAVAHHEGHGRRIGRDTGMLWMHGDPEVS